jgi:hypothetical protein
MHQCCKVTLDEIAAGFVDQVEMLDGTRSRPPAAGTRSGGNRSGFDEHRRLAPARRAW